MSIAAVLAGDLRWHLEHGDALDVLRVVPDACVDAVVTDPPYGIGYRSLLTGTIANDDRPFIWWLRDAWRVTVDGGALVCFCRWDVQEAFRFAIELAGFTLRSQVIWDREHHGMGNLAQQFGPQHDVIWFATKGRFRFRNGRPVSVIRVRRPHTGARHPTEKPLELMERLVGPVSPVDGVVLDPFASSGSTGVAALQLGRRFIGVELDEHHAATSRARLETGSSTPDRASRRTRAASDRARTGSA